MQITSQRLPIGVENKTKLDMPFNHVSSTDFMKLRVLGYEHLTKDHSVDINGFCHCMPYPLALPTFGSIKQNIRAFFVPYRLCFPQWHRFFSDNLGVNYGNVNLVQNPPYFYEKDIIDLFFVNSTYQPQLSVVVTTPNFDYKVGGNKYNLTALGRRLASVFYSLGYSIFGNDKSEIPFNALALLALGRVYIDWYANPQYLDGTDVLAIESMLAYNDPSTPLHLTATELWHIALLASIVNYDSDAVFNFAWDNPVSPTNQQHSLMTVDDITGGSAYVYSTVEGTPLMVNDTVISDTELGTEYIHRMLRKVDSYQQRHRLAGARSIDRALAQFGVKPKSLQVDRSIYIGYKSDDIVINPIYATANGSSGLGSSSVGDYAGKGQGHVEGSWEFHSDEEGIILILHSLIPSAGFYQGYDRNNRRMLKTEFFNPEYDNIVGIIEKGEVYTSNDDTFATNVMDYTKAFGFSGQYHEQKVPRSFITGDIRFISAGDTNDAWHLMRRFDDSNFPNGISDVVHSYDFARGNDASDYDRIFQYTGEDRDHFVLLSHFGVSAHAPMSRLFDVVEFPEKSEKINIQQNGTQVN